MGWSTGQEIMDGVVQCLLKKKVARSKRFKIYQELIQLFEIYDADTLEECKGTDQMFDQAFDEIHPICDICEDPLDEGWCYTCETGDLR